MFLRSQTRMHGLDLSGIIKKQALRIFFFCGLKIETRSSKKQLLLLTSSELVMTEKTNKQTNNKNEIK